MNGTSFFRLLGLAFLNLCAVYIVRHWKPDRTCAPSEECVSCPFPCDLRDGRGDHGKENL